jgi:hypothetical protein
MSLPLKLQPQRGDDRAGIIAQESLGEFGILQPRAAITAGCESGRQINGRIGAQLHQINGLPPFRRFIGSACGNHLADNAGQQIGGVLPSDQVETLEALVDEIKRVSAIGKDAVGLGRDEKFR